MKLNEILQEGITEKQFEKLEDALQEILGAGIDVSGLEIVNDTHHDISIVDVESRLEIILGLTGTFDDDNSAKITGWAASLESPTRLIKSESGKFNVAVVKYDRPDSVKAVAQMIVTALEENNLILKHNNIYYLSDT